MWALFQKVKKWWQGLTATPVAADIKYDSAIEKPQTTEAALVADLLSTNKEHITGIPESAVPDGYSYVSHIGKKLGDAQSLGKTLFLSPHPSDVSADFFPLLIDRMQSMGGECRQILLTRGEGGDSGGEYRKVLMERGMVAESLLCKEGILKLRQAEEERSSKIFSLNQDYLTTKEGKHTFSDDEFYFPDGQLMKHLPQLTERLMDYIKQENPDRLAIPGIYPDHPDHLATTIAAINAVIRLREQGFFKDKKIEIITSDPEFAVAIGQPWAVKQIPEDFGGTLQRNTKEYSELHIDPIIKYYKYRYIQDKETGLIYPVPDITAKADGEVSFDNNPIAVAPYIIAATEEAEQKKIEAMKGHDSQFNHGKPYLRLVREVDELRAYELLSGASHGKIKYAFGLYPINIDGITTKENTLVDLLPDVYQLKYQHPTQIH